MADENLDEGKGRTPGSIDRLGMLALAGVVVGTVGEFLAPYSDVAELFSHFKVIYLLGALAAFGAFAWLRSKWVALLTLPFLLFHAAGVLPWYFPNRDGPSPDTLRDIRIVSANVYSTNDRHEEFIEWVRSVDPDVLLVQEVTPQWVESFEELVREYPYVKTDPRGDNFGMATYSRIPVEIFEVRFPPGVGVPAISSRMQVRGRTVRLLNFHTLPPAGGEMSKTRNGQLAYLGDFVRESDELAVVVGDLNVTMWSPYYKKMIEATGFRDARRGRGVVPTWSSIPGLPPLLPLDYALVSEGVEVVDFQVGPDLGSDHRPIVVDLVVSGR